MRVSEQVLEQARFRSAELAQEPVRVPEREPVRALEPAQEPELVRALALVPEQVAVAAAERPRSCQSF